MLSRNAACYLLIPNEQNARLLAPGVVIGLAGQDAVLRFEEAINLEPGADAIVYAQVRGKFFQQAVRICAMPADPAQPNAAANPVSAAAAAAGSNDSIGAVLAINCVGEPVSADSRGSFRVSIAANPLSGTVARQRNCQIVDISAEGCAVICPQPLVVGQTVEVCFSAEGLTVEGAMKVQTVKTLRNGALRFGLFASDTKSITRRTLEKLSMSMQRLQLKRVTGAA